MRKISRESLARLPEVRRAYRDPNGYVYLDVPVSEALSGWTELTEEEHESVRPLSDVDRRKWESWHQRGVEAVDPETGAVTFRGPDGAA